MKKLVFRNLVLVATLTVCRSESTTEFCTDRSCEHIPDSEVVSSKSNKDQDIVDKSTQDSLLQIFGQYVFNNQDLQNALWHKLIISGLIIFCVLVSLVLWYLNVGILFILTFNCTMIILYKVLGPVWVYWLLWKCVVYAKYCLSLMVNHPYISAAVIMIIFSWSSYWTFKRCYKEYNRFGREERMENVINAQLEEIKEQQKEMLILLKELKSATSR